MKDSRSNRTALTWILFLAGLVFIGLVASMLGRSAAATQAAVGEQLLPDLVPYPASDVQIANSKRKSKELRFDYSVVNAGTGVLELTWRSEDCDGDGVVRNDRTAVQRMFTDSAASSSAGFFDRNDDTAYTTRNVGCFVFHPKHHHWHLENFARYELLAWSPSAGRGNVIGTTDKVSFCISDFVRSNLQLPGSPSSGYFTTCNRDGDQGLSIGWVDGYNSNLEGQSITLDSSIAGTFCLVQTADPANEIAESDDSNNESSVLVTISGTTVTTGGTC